ncbi:MAG: RNA 2',3'-cyclic phosphodiesterase [Desulfobulbaceae bacterium]|nr:MAG: RNA 2',3'-cyclic phosphodiesterase [Desulfobulbaceae bacterium]
MSTKRLFIGVELDEFSRNILGSLGPVVQGGQPTPIDQLHLTIRFIGEVEGTLFKDIAEALRSVSFQPFPLTIEGVGHFPPRGKPKVLWAGIKGGGDLLLLRNHINNALFRCGIPPEKRKFHPHITLARLKSTSAKRVAEFLQNYHDLETPTQSINGFTLFSSVLTQEGAIHTVEQRYRF